MFTGVTPGQKLAQLLPNRGDKTALGKALRLGSPYDNVQKWCNDRGFNLRNQREVEKLRGLPEGYFSENDQEKPAAAAKQAIYPSLEKFLSSPAAHDVGPEEEAYLRAYRDPDGDPGDSFWLVQRIAYRSRSQRELRAPPQQAGGLEATPQSRVVVVEADAEEGLRDRFRRVLIATAQKMKWDVPSKTLDRLVKAAHDEIGKDTDLKALARRMLEAERDGAKPGQTVDSKAKAEKAGMRRSRQSKRK